MIFHPSKLFVTDYDGTLLTDDKIIHPNDFDTLARMQKQGVVTAIATGRSLFSFERSLEVMGLVSRELPIDYLIFSTGAGLMDTGSGKLLRSLDLEGPHIQAACSYFDAKGFDYMVHQPIPDTPYFIYKKQGGKNPDFQARLDLYPDFGRPLNRDFSILKRATEVLAIVPGSDPDLAFGEIRSSLREMSVIFATSPLDHSSVWIEVFHPGVSKSRTVDWLCQSLGINPGQVAAVGNDYNDLDLLKWSGKGFLVENGPESMKGEFSCVGSNNAGGISQAAELAGFLN